MLPTRTVDVACRYVKNSAAWDRHPQPEIRQRLLDACTDYALEHGLPDRLGPLAAAAGTSSRMLIYHFGTRDGLLREILGQARQRQLEAFTELLRVRPDEPYPATLSRRLVRDDRTARPALPAHAPARAACAGYGVVCVGVVVVAVGAGGCGGTAICARRTIRPGFVGFATRSRVTRTCANVGVWGVRSATTSSVPLSLTVDFGKPMKSSWAGEL